MNNAILYLFLQIRKKLIMKQTMMEKSEKAKKLREQRKYGKKVSILSTHLFFLKGQQWWSHWHITFYYVILVHVVI